MARLAAIALALVAAFAFGLATGHYRQWPFDLLRDAKRAVTGAAGGLSAPDVLAAADVDRRLTGPVDVVMLGDSLTQRGRWNELFPDLRIANRGIGGDTVAGVEQRLATVLAVAPKTVVLTIGTNDIAERHDPLGARAALARIVDKLAPRVRLILVAIPPCDCGRANNAAIVAWNEAVRVIAARRGLAFVDLHSALLKNGRVDPSLFVDGVHLNGEAYARWRSLLASSLVRR